MSKSIKCKSCKQEISKGTSYCPHCGKKQSNFFMRHKVITIIGILIIIGIFSHYNKNSNNKTANVQTKTSTTTVTSSQNKTVSNSKPTKSNTPVPTIKARQVIGTATNLGAGTFTVGTDIKAGLYDVTPTDGSGNLIITNKDKTLNTNEVLGNLDDIGVSKVRVKISDGDTIKLESINNTHFEPVTNPFVTTYQLTTLYAGRWIVGEDIAIGKYNVTTIKGSGNFIIYDSLGIPETNEILGGDYGVSNVTVTLKEGDIINLASLNQVNFTPMN